MKVKILAVVIVFGLIGILRANIVNSNSIIQDDIEYYIQTDKSVYDLGENVEMLYRITNLSQESITFTLPYNPVWNFWAETGGQCIWTGMYSKLFEVTDLVIEAGESVEFPEFNPPFTWDLRDDDGILIQPGQYFVIGGLDEDYYDYTKVSVPIDVVPEPATVFFISIGLPFLRFFLKKQI